MRVKLADVDKEFEKDPCLKRDDLRMLREWLEKQPHLPKIDDLRLIRFLHCGYCSVEKAKVLIENFYTARTHAPDLFLNKSVTDKIVRQQSDFLCLALFPKATSSTKDDVFFIRIADTNSELFNYNATIKAFDMAINLFQLQKGIVPGQVFILDSEGLSLSHVVKINLATTVKFAHYLQDCLPHRLKAIHIINVSAITETLFVFVKPLIKKEYVDLIHFHPKIETFYKHVPRDLMPLEYGGKSPSWKKLHVTFRDRVLEGQDFFDEENSHFTDESKRIGAPKTMADIYGVEGTFRKLEID